MFIPEFSQINSPFLFWFLSVICAFSIGFSKNGIAGAGILVIPLMAHIFPARESTGILLPMLIFGDFIALWSFRRYGDRKLVLRALPWAFIGIISGWLLMKMPVFSGRFFKIFIGSVVVLVILTGEYLNYRGGDIQKRIPHSILFSVLFGVLGGIDTMTANAAGPIFAIYLLSLGLGKENFIGTNAIIFLVLNLIKVPFSINLGLISPSTLHFNLLMLPFIALGAYLGFITARRIPQQVFNSLIKILALAASLKLFF